MTDPTHRELQRQIREEAGNRCGYCLSPQHLVLGPLEIEHLHPRSKGGTEQQSNLWLACRMCNNFKAAQISTNDPQTGKTVSLFNPRRDDWSQHFHWSEDGVRILGNTACGRATIIALQLNNIVATTVRQNWVRAGWHPPDLK